MKRILIALALPLSAMTARASYVDADVAMKAAERFLADYDGRSCALEGVMTEDEGGNTLLYIFNFRNGGWTIVSGSDHTKPVLAFNPTGRYERGTDEANAFLNAYREVVLQSESSIDSESVQTALSQWYGREASLRSGSFKYTEGEDLLAPQDRGEVIWGQTGGLYNAQCPVNLECKDGHAVAGCGAIALGQLLWYWQYPSSMNFSYNSEKKDYNFDWSLIPNKLDKESSSSEVIETSKLIHECGVSVNMAYGCVEGSSASIIDQGLYTWFGVSKSVTVIRKLLSDEEWANAVMNEIGHGRPLIVKGSCEEQGHWYLLTGYKRVGGDFFCHYNFGWDGSSNGYYDSSVEDKSVCLSSMSIMMGVSPVFNEYEGLYVSGLYKKITPEAIVVEEEMSDGTQAMLKPTKNADIELVSGEKVVFRSGFVLPEGGKMRAAVREEPTDAIEAKVMSHELVDGKFSVEVKNADTWVFILTEKDSKNILAKSGRIDKDGMVEVDLSGIELNEYSSYRFYVHNGYGRAKELRGIFAYDHYRICDSKPVGSKNYEMVYFNPDATGTRALEDEEIDEEISVYPNPAKDMVSISCGKASELSDVELCGLDGKLIRRYGKIENFGSVSVADIPKGVYVVKLKADGRQNSTVLIKE